jgi:hypothetical protein
VNLLALTLGDGVELGVALGTAVLALATWRMAAATREMAKKAGKQADAADRLSRIAEEQLGIDTKRLEVSTEPRLQVARRGDGSPVLQWTPASGSFTVVIHNPADARSEFAGCSIVIPGAGTFNGTLAEASRIIGPDQKVATTFSLGDTGMRQAVEGASLSYTMTYRRPGDPETKKVIATFKAKDRGKRWILEDERSHGSASW